MRLASAGALALCIGQLALVTHGQAQPERTLRLSLLGHEIGAERSTIERSGSTATLHSHFEYKDRGLTVALDGTLTYRDNDFTPISYEAHGKSYRYFAVDASVPSVPAGRPAFPIEGMAPLSVQEVLIRYWLAHGRPETITALPSGDALHIAEVTTGVGGRFALPRLRQFVIDGVIWGREHAWLDAEDLHLAAIATTAGVMPFQGVDDSVPASLRQAFGMIAVGADVFSPDAQMPTPVQRDRFALTNARLIDGTGKPPVEHATVLVENDRIAAAGPASSVHIPGDVPIVDVGGKSVLPGLWDMHAHVGQLEWGPAYLSEGVTTIRDMGGEFGILLALREAWNASGAPPRGATASGPSVPRGVGPRLLLAGLIDGPGPDAFGSVTAANPVEGRAAVTKYNEYHFDEVKLYNLLDRPTAAAIIDAAHGMKMMVTGHIPNGLTLKDVVEMGFDQVAHLVVRAAPGTPEMRDTIALLKAHGTVMDPTISWNELLGRSPQTPIESFQPGITRLPAPLRRLLEGATGGPVTPAQARARLERQLAIVKALHDGGVPFTAGTDKGVPGASVQREIELYVQAGLSPMDAIRAATTIPARTMHLDRETGTIAPGYRADLIVVDGNPLAHIEDLRKVTLTCTDGRLYETTRLARAAGFVSNP